jgi:hypothetical protein
LRLQEGAMSKEEERCDLCGELGEFGEDLELCASCKDVFCPDCGGYCCEEHDTAQGDWFCVECQEATAKDE